MKVVSGPTLPDLCFCFRYNYRYYFCRVECSAGGHMSNFWLTVPEVAVSFSRIFKMFKLYSATFASRDLVWIKKFEIKKARNLIFWLCDISTALFKGQKHRGHPDVAIISILKCVGERERCFRTARSSVYIQFAEDTLHFAMDNVFWCLSIIRTLLKSDP